MSGERVDTRRLRSFPQEVLRDLRDACAQIQSEGENFFEEEITLEQGEGHALCVRTSEDDDVVYVRRKKPNGQLFPGYSRLVKNRSPEPCNTMVLAFKRKDNGEYIVVMAHFGTLDTSFPEPWDYDYFSKRKDPEGERDRAVEFWSNHALLYDHFNLDPSTEITECPW